MAEQTLHLDIPDDLYHELKKRAEAAQLPLEVELLNLAAAMLALNKANDLANALTRYAEEVSRSVGTVSLHLLAAARTSNAGEKRHALDILDALPGHLAFHSAEEVDAYLREERESWEG